MVRTQSEPGTPPLTEMFVYLTNFCNCSCQHCWIISTTSAGKTKPRVFLSLEVFRAALAEGIPLGLSSIKWTGGEPTIHPHFPMLLRLQCDRGLSCRLETNGMKVTRALAQLLRDCQTRHVAVSIDGSVPETHDRIRGVRGAFQCAVIGLKNLAEVGFKPQIIMSLMKSNILELDGLLELARAFEAGSVKLNIVQPTLRGLEIHESGGALSISDLVELERRLDREIRPSYAFPIFLDIPPAFCSLKSIINGKNRRVCGVQSSIGLLADGSYALCGIGENRPGLVFGTAGKGELSNIWENHPIVRDLRESVPQKLKGVCGRCLMKSFCRGSCVAQSYYRTNDILAPFWFCDAAAKEGLLPEHRLAPIRVDTGVSALPG